MYTQTQKLKDIIFILLLICHKLFNSKININRSCGVASRNIMKFYLLLDDILIFGLNKRSKFVKKLTIKTSCCHYMVIRFFKLYFLAGKTVLKDYYLCSNSL